MDEHHLRRIRIRRGTNSQRKEVLFEEGEFVYVNDIKRLYVGDRKTYGGVRVSNTNHVESSAIRPINSDVGDLLYNKSDKATYIVDKDGKLKKIIYSSDDVYKYKIQLDELELLLLKLEKLCCNTEFALDTDDGINILVDYGDWIKVKDYAANVDVVQCKPPVISEKYLDLKSDKTYILDIQNYKSSPDIIFINNTIDTDGNTPPQDIKIVEDSVNASKDIKILEVTDTTIKFQAILPDPKKIISLGTFIDYSIQNSCSARQKENSSVTGIVYNTSILVDKVEIGVYKTFTSSKSSYKMYKLIDPVTNEYPFDKNCWFIFYFDSDAAADSYYITEISKKPKLINGNWILEKKAFGQIGPVRNKGMFIFWHPKDFDLNVWNEGSGRNFWSCFPLFDPSKHINDPNYLFTEETNRPTEQQISECLKSKSLTVQKNYTDVYTGTEIPSFIST